MSSKVKTAAQQNLILCLNCYHLNSKSNSNCSRCLGRIELRKDPNFQWTLAWLFTAIILYVPANVLPVMTTVSFGLSLPNTIVSGVIDLWQHGSYIIALVIFFASIVIPIFKICVIAWLVISIKLGYGVAKKQRTKLYRFIEWIGRWSMIDVYVVAILVSLIQLGGVMQIEPGWAALAFCGVVLATMFSANSFDPRLIWDSIKEK